jgi:hypothetical protein
VESDGVMLKIKLMFDVQIENDKPDVVHGNKHKL